MKGPDTGEDTYNLTVQSDAQHYSLDAPGSEIRAQAEVISTTGMGHFETYREAASVEAQVLKYIFSRMKYSFQENPCRRAQRAKTKTTVNWTRNRTSGKV